MSGCTDPAMACTYGLFTVEMTIAWIGFWGSIIWFTANRFREVSS